MISRKNNDYKNMYFRGTLKVAEVESRFKDVQVEEFISNLEKFGFKLKWKDLSHTYFYLMDFKKVDKAKKKAPEFSLKPCIYKKRWNKDRFNCTFITNVYFRLELFVLFQ